MMMRGYRSVSEQRQELVELENAVNADGLNPPRLAAMSFRLAILAVEALLTIALEVQGVGRAAGRHERDRGGAGW